MPCTNLMTFKNIERHEMRERERERERERIPDRNGYPICNIWQIGTGPLG